LLRDANLIHKSAVGAAKVTNEEATVGARDHRVIPRRAIVGQDHVVIFSTPKTRDAIRLQRNSIA
jgi:hypothetical protein